MILGTYAAIGTQAAAEVFLCLLRRHQQELGVPIMEAIGETNARCEDLKVVEDLVTEAIDSEVVAGLPDSTEGKEERIGVVVGLLALIYSREDVVRAQTGPREWGKGSTVQRAGTAGQPCTCGA